MTQQRPLHEALAILDPPTLTTVSESFIKFSEIFDSIMIKTLSLKVELIFIYKYITRLHGMKPKDTSAGRWIGTFVNLHPE